MLTYNEVLNLNYYKKSAYTGWINPVRFLIRMEQPENADPIFHAFVWPGPYIFSLTDDKDKIDFTAPFSEDGKKQVVDWINEQYENYKDVWSGKKL